MLEIDWQDKPWGGLGATAAGLSLVVFCFDRSWRWSMRKIGSQTDIANGYEDTKEAAKTLVEQNTRIYYENAQRRLND